MRCEAVVSTDAALCDPGIGQQVSVNHGLLVRRNWISMESFSVSSAGWTPVRLQPIAADLKLAQ
jgi:hypothetical protein